MTGLTVRSGGPRMVQVFQADKNVWAKGRAMDLPRGDFGAGLLSRGRILVVAGEYAPLTS